jgi:hypothetical protein
MCSFTTLKKNARDFHRLQPEPDFNNFLSFGLSQDGLRRAHSSRELAEPFRQQQMKGKL